MRLIFAFCSGLSSVASAIVIVACVDFALAAVKNILESITGSSLGIEDLDIAQISESGEEKINSIPPRPLPRG